MKTPKHFFKQCEELEESDLFRAPGFRELFGEEREAHISAMEKVGYVTRRLTTGKRRPDLKNTCLHVYVKIESK